MTLAFGPVKLDFGFRSRDLWFLTSFIQLFPGEYDVTDPIIPLGIMRHGSNYSHGNITSLIQLFPWQYYVTDLIIPLGILRHKLPA